MGLLFEGELPAAAVVAPTIIVATTMDVATMKLMPLLNVPFVGVAIL